MNKEACFTHNTDNWRTPSNLYDFIVNKLNYIDLFEYCSSFDQYEKSDYINKNLFINPPYSHLRTLKFRNYIDTLINQGNRIKLLIPSRTDTELFHFLSKYCIQITFFKGRLKFNDTGSAPFPSMIMDLSLFKFFPTFVSYSTLEDYIYGSTNSKNKIH